MEVKKKVKKKQSWYWQLGTLAIILGLAGMILAVLVLFLTSLNWFVAILGIPGVGLAFFGIFLRAIAEMKYK